MPNDAKPIDFAIKVNSTALATNTRKDVQAITIHEDLTAASMFTIELNNWDENSLAFTWSDDKLFAPGGEVEISLGYVDDTEKVMVGEITSIEPFFSSEETSVIIRGYDHRHRLLRGRKTRSFTETKDSTIAKQIAKEAGLAAQVTATTVTLEYILQHNQTDLAFLQERARRIGYEVYVKDKTLYFRARKNDTSAVVKLSLAEDLIELLPRLTTMSQVGEVVVQGWDIHKKESIVSSAAAGSESTTMGGSTSGPKAANSAFGATTRAYVRQPVGTQPEADQIAAGQLNDIAMAYISGEGSCNGRYDLKAGTIVEIEGVGTQFSGLYYLTTVKHIFHVDYGYHTRFTYQRNAV